MFCSRRHFQCKKSWLNDANYRARELAERCSYEIIWRYAKLLATKWIKFCEILKRHIWLLDFLRGALEQISEPLFSSTLQRSGSHWKWWHCLSPWHSNGEAAAQTPCHQRWAWRWQCFLHCRCECRLTCGNWTSWQWLGCFSPKTAQTFFPFWFDSRRKINNSQSKGPWRRLLRMKHNNLIKKDDQIDCVDLWFQKKLVGKIDFSICGQKTENSNKTMREMLCFVVKIIISHNFC